MSNFFPPVSLLIADDHQLFIDGLCKILENEQIIASIRSVNNGNAVLEEIASCPVECIIMDINMPVLNGLKTSVQKTKKFFRKILIPWKSPTRENHDSRDPKTDFVALII